MLVWVISRPVPDRLSDPSTQPATSGRGSDPPIASQATAADAYPTLAVHPVVRAPRGPHPAAAPGEYRLAMTQLLRLGHPAVMGVLNVTPDSFSDGGRYSDLPAAVLHGLELVGEGADLIDVGGESTRPGAARVDAETELSRVLPVIAELVAAGVTVSVDTTRAAVASAALAAGAAMVNDVSGGLADPGMAAVVAEAGCPWVLMHWRGHSRDMQQLATYTDVVAEVRDELRERIDAAMAAGVAAEQILIDPGLGFAKTAEHNWRLSAHLDELVALGFPVLVGASRKSYLGALLADATGQPRPASARVEATVATSVLAVQAGVWGVRVHDVLATVDALRVLAATEAAK